MQGEKEKATTTTPLTLVERGAMVSAIEDDVDWRELPGKPAHLGVVGEMTEGIAELIQHEAAKWHLVVDLDGAARFWVSYISELPLSPPMHAHRSLPSEPNQLGQLARRLGGKRSLGGVAILNQFLNRWTSALYPS